MDFPWDLGPLSCSSTFAHGGGIGHPGICSLTPRFSEQGAVLGAQDRPGPAFMEHSVYKAT